MSDPIANPGTWSMILAEAAARIRGMNFVELVKWVRYKLSVRWREWRLGIDTRGSIPWHQLGLEPDSIDYGPVDWQALESALHHIDIRPDYDVFLDYGAGKGRAVIMAAMHPFFRVLGVEMSGSLCTVAKRNIRRARRRLCSQRIEIVETNAAQYPVPTDVSVIFLFNPFTGRTLNAVVDQIHASLKRRPRPLTIIYLHPAAAPNVFAQCDWLGPPQPLPTGYLEGVRLVMHQNVLNERSLI